jgi:hypothetical protein
MDQTINEDQLLQLVCSLVPDPGSPGILHSALGELLLQRLGAKFKTLSPGNVSLAEYLEARPDLFQSATNDKMFLVTTRTPARHQSTTSAWHVSMMDFSKDVSARRGVGLRAASTEVGSADEKDIKETSHNSQLGCTHTETAWVAAEVALMRGRALRQCGLHIMEISKRAKKTGMPWPSKGAYMKLVVNALKVDPDLRVEKTPNNSDVFMAAKLCADSTSQSKGRTAARSKWDREEARGGALKLALSAQPPAEVDLIDKLRSMKRDLLLEFVQANLNKVSTIKLREMLTVARRNVTNEV